MLRFRSFPLTIALLSAMSSLCLAKNVSQVEYFRQRVADVRYYEAAHDLPETRIFKILETASDEEIRQFLAKEYRRILGPNSAVKLTDEEKNELKSLRNQIADEVYYKATRSQRITIDDVLLKSMTLEQLYLYKKNVLRSP